MGISPKMLKDFEVLPNLPKREKKMQRRPRKKINVGKKKGSPRNWNLDKKRLATGYIDITKCTCLKISA